MKHWSAVLDKYNPCADGLAFARSHKTMQAAWDACENPQWMIWLLGKSGADRKVLVRIACDCAATVLPLWRKRYPDDNRPANAIRVARAWLRGKATLDEVRAARAAAGAAGAAAGAARAAAGAAGAAWAAGAAAGAAWAVAGAARAAARVAYAAYAARVAGAAYAASAARATWAAGPAGDAARAAANRHMARIIRKAVPEPKGEQA